MALRLGLDLVDEVIAHGRPVDDPVRWRLVDPRRMRTEAIADRLWLRVLDVPAALSARRSAAPGRLVIDVEGVDASGSAHDRQRVLGRWAIEAGPDATAVERAGPGAPTDLRLGVAELGSLYLGGVTATTLAAAGRVVEERPGALFTADRLWATTTMMSPLTSTEF